MPFQQERMPFRAWEYRTETGLTGDEVDLAGYPVAAVDGDIGHVDEATYPVGSSYLVVDTGPWIFGRKVLLPAGVVERIDTVEKKVYVDRTKDQIKAAPEYDQTVDDAQYRDRLGGYYAETYNGPDTRI
jgi:PRC-barrel domain